MSKLKATPGPWIEGIDGNLRIYGPDNMGEHSGLIAQVYKGRSNLKLMLAAPELYDALDNLIDACGHDTYAKMELEAAVAALAKARGEQQ